MVISLHTTQSPVSRSERMKINENWQRIIEGLSKLQLQINILAGGEEVDELILRINQAIEMVSTALQDTEKVIIEANKATMNAQEASDNANTAVKVVNEAMGEAGQLMANLDALKAELEQMKYKLETLSTGAEAATINANNAAQVVTNLTDAISEAITVANKATQEANNAAQLIAGWGTASVWNATTEYVKNNITTYNGSTWQSLTTNKNSVPSESNKDWILLAQRGVDGTGSVSMVAGKSPDADGNVPLTSIDIGAETPSGAQEKANKIQEWVQAHGLGTNQPELISLPDSLLNKMESGFWNVENKPGSVSLPNDIENFHVYVGIKSDDQSDKIYQTFLAISQKTAKTYTRVITNDGQVNNHLDDTGWIEGGEGGTGSGLKLNINTYNLQTTMDNQKTWDLPKELYDKNNDEIIVFHNGIYLPPISWDITGNASSGYVLTIPDNPIEKQIDNNVSILIFKNVPATGDEQFSGSLLTDGSVTMNKLSQDVHDAINGASEKVEIVDNLTVGGSNKALSAEMGKNLKAIVDEKVDKTELDVLKTEVNEHLDQMKPKVDNSWQKGVYNNIDFSNLGDGNYTRFLTVQPNEWTSTTNVEILYIIVPITDSSGVIKLTLSSASSATDSAGGATVEYVYQAWDGQIFFQNRIISNIGEKFAKNYRIADMTAAGSSKELLIPIIKAPTANNYLGIKLEIQSKTASINTVKGVRKSIESTGSPTGQGYPWTPQKSAIDSKFPLNTTRANNADLNTFKTNGVFALGDGLVNGVTPSHYGAYSTLYVSTSADVITQLLVDYLGNSYTRAGAGAGTTNWHDWKRLLTQDDYDQLFTLFSSFKTKIASATTDKGVPTNADATGDQMAANIRAIPTGKKTYTHNFSTPNMNNGQTVTLTSGAMSFVPKFSTSPAPGCMIYDGYMQDMTPFNFIQTFHISNQVVNNIGNGMYTVSVTFKNGGNYWVGNNTPVIFME